MTLTKAELTEYVGSRFNISRPKSRTVIEQIFETICQCLERGEQVKICGFGTFEPRDKYQRPGRNPKTGEKKDVPARRVVTFRPAPKLKAKVENFKSEPSSS